MMTYTICLLYPCIDNCLLIFDSFDKRFTISYSKISMDGHVYRIFSLQFKNNDRSTFLSGGWDNTIQVVKELIRINYLVSQ